MPVRVHYSSLAKLLLIRISIKNKTRSGRPRHAYDGGLLFKEVLLPSTTYMKYSPSLPSQPGILVYFFQVLL